MMPSDLIPERATNVVGSLAVLGKPDAHMIANLLDLIGIAAQHTGGGILSYPPNALLVGGTATYTSYGELLNLAQLNAARLQSHFQRKAHYINAITQDKIVLVHFESAWDTIVWFWSVIFAGAVPAISAPSMLSNSVGERKKHLAHLNITLDQPLCLTRQSLLGPFVEHDDSSRLQVLSVEDLLSASTADDLWAKPSPSPSDLAALMLTSGSSGNSKAVRLTHGQIIAAVRGKAQFANPHPHHAYMSWIGMDHVANLTEIHLSAMFLGLPQVQVSAADLLVDPLQLLNLVSRHKVQRTFAPNFFLARLRRALESGDRLTLDANLSLESLEWLGSGGEATAVEVCGALQRLLKPYGARNDVIVPGFGMTETCAGCIYNRSCPSYDKERSLDFSSLGTNIPGLRVRITRQQKLGGGISDDCLNGFPNGSYTGSLNGSSNGSSSSSRNGSVDSSSGAFSERFSNSSSSSPSDGSPDRSFFGVEAPQGEVGSLEVSGEVVFQSYHNNPAATADSFTSDGWFKTGDLAYIDDHGYLNLSGRIKEVIIVNGVKYLPLELVAALEEAAIPGTTPSFFCAFSSRTVDPSLDSECLVVVYLPSFAATDDAARFATQDAIVKTVSMQTKTRPRVVPLRREQLHKSTLGKLSSARIQAAFEAGEFTAQIAANDTAVARHRQLTRGHPESETEAIVLEEMRKQLALPADDDFGVNDSVFTMGASSMDLIALINNLKRRLGPGVSISLIDILSHPTAKGLTARLLVTRDGSSAREYNPVVQLNSSGHKAPLWLIHPGVGEVLVFINLAKYIIDRPVYGMRAKGFNPGEVPFTTIDEILTCYVDNIKKTQPTGPYALAGYSYGAMLAFEISKRLERLGDEVRYCGSWNLPPHIKARMRELDWEECVANLFYFVSLVDQDVAIAQTPAMRAMADRAAAVRHLRALSDPVRWAELDLTEEDYLNWTDVASKLQGMARDYEPAGNVKCMDVFVATPLKQVATDREDWLNNKLRPWTAFVREDVRFHDVEGAHYTMLGPTYVAGFAETLRKVLVERGL